MIADLLWSDLHSQKLPISREQFRASFRTCRINALLASSKSTPSNDIHCYYLHYDSSNAISLSITTVYVTFVSSLGLPEYNARVMLLTTNSIPEE